MTPTGGRSHPPTLLTLLGRGLDEAKVERGSALVVAVSGGGDSMALLHGLRPEAEAEMALVAAFAVPLGVPFRVVRLALEDGGNLHARAREARYTALREVAAGRAIATAHHADDRAETVLLRMLRGAGAKGLAVLPARSEDLVRPLLRARKSDVLAHLERHSVPFVEDPSNHAARFARARVRDEVLPLLASLDPSIVEHLCALSDELGRTHNGDDGSFIYPLGRGVRESLAALARSRSPGARVALPLGLVATYDRDHAERSRK